MKKILYTENWKIAQHSQDFLVALAANMSRAEVIHLSHYAASERLLASLGVLDYENPGRGVILQQGLQGEQVTGLMWGKCQNTPGFRKDFKCETEAGKKKRFYSRLTMSPLQILKF